MAAPWPMQATSASALPNLEILADADDPVGWCARVLGEKDTVEDVLAGRATEANAPWSKQIEIMESVRDNRRTVVRSGHDVGKTYTAARAGLWFLYTHTPSVVLTTAPRLGQVRDLLWARWREAYNKAVIPLGGECLTMRCHPMGRDNPTWFAVGLTAKDANSFQGYHESYVLLILDEAPGVSPEIHIACEGMLSGENVRILEIGNPIRKSGPFYQAFRSPLWNGIHISVLEHPNVVHQRLIYPSAVSPSWPKERKQEWGEGSPLYISRVEGDFSDEGTDTLIPLSWVEAAIDRKVTDEGPSSIGVDVARKGPNETVFCKITGRRAKMIVNYQGKDLMKTVGRMVMLAPTVDQIGVDDTGLGGSVTDRLEELKIAVVPLIAGAKADDAENFVDRASEMMWALREAFRETYEMATAGEDDPDRGISIENDDLLTYQLTSREYDFRSDGRIKLEPKREMSGRSEKSPDRADALAMAWWLRNKKKARFASGGSDDPEVEKYHREQEAERVRMRLPEDDDGRIHDPRPRRLMGV